MESYTNLDLHLQFVRFFPDERFHMDRSNDQKYILPTSKVTGNFYHWRKLYAMFFTSVNFKYLLLRLHNTETKK